MKAFKVTFMLKVLAICSILTSRRFELHSTNKSGNKSKTTFDYAEIREVYNGKKEEHAKL